MKYLLSIGACVAILAVTASASASTTSDRLPVTPVASTQNASSSGEFLLTRDAHDHDRDRDHDHDRGGDHDG
jgi:hypothetical protein